MIPFCALNGIWMVSSRSWKRGEGQRQRQREAREYLLADFGAYCLCDLSWGPLRSDILISGSRASSQGPGSLPKARSLNKNAEPQILTFWDVIGDEIRPFSFWER